MERYTVYGLTGLTPADTADRIDAYLSGLGYTVENIGTRYDPQAGELHVTLSADGDPTNDLRAYTSTPTPAETEKTGHIEAGRATVSAARSNPNAPRTPQEINAFITAVSELLPELQGL
jgi:hypothetical protein